MKKTISVLLVAVMLLSLVACGGGIKQEQIVGAWKVTAAKGNSDVQNLVGAYLNLMSGGSYFWTVNGVIALNGTYRLSGSRLYLDDDYANISLNGDTLTLKDGSGEITLVRQ